MKFTKIFFYIKSSLHDHAGVHFGVEGWSPKINMDIFGEPENQRVLADDKVSKRMILIQSRLHMAMQGCILMLRVRARKSVDIFEEPENSSIF